MSYLYDDWMRRLFSHHLLRQLTEHQVNDQEPQRKQRTPHHAELHGLRAQEHNKMAIITNPEKFIAQLQQMFRQNLNRDLTI